MFWHGFIIGCWIGCALGIVIMGFLTNRRENDET